MLTKFQQKWSKTGFCRKLAFVQNDEPRLFPCTRGRHTSGCGRHPQAFHVLTGGAPMLGWHAVPTGPMPAGAVPAGVEPVPGPVRHGVRVHAVNILIVIADGSKIPTGAL